MEKKIQELINEIKALSSDTARKFEHILEDLHSIKKELSESNKTPTPSSPYIGNLQVIVDAGHGGLHPETGKYMTFPHHGKFYKFDDGFTAYEGEINRLIAQKLCTLLDKAGIRYTKIYHEYLDTPLATLVQKANMAYQTFKSVNSKNKSILLSFHSNAQGMANQGKGEQADFWSVWTTRGTTKSDTIAETWYREHQKLCGEEVAMKKQAWTDGDADYEADFTIIYATYMPAVLVENLFFTNRKNAEKLYTEAYQDKSALAAFNTVVWCLENFDKI